MYSSSVAEDEPKNTNTGQGIKERREALGLTQNDLAERADVSQAAISNLENEKHRRPNKRGRVEAKVRNALDQVEKERRGNAPSGLPRPVDPKPVGLRFPGGAMPSASNRLSRAKVLTDVMTKLGGPEGGGGVAVALRGGPLTGTSTLVNLITDDLGSDVMVLNVRAYTVDNTTHETQCQQIVDLIAYAAHFELGFPVSGHPLSPQNISRWMEQQIRTLYGETNAHKVLLVADGLTDLLPKTLGWFYNGLVRSCVNGNTLGCLFVESPTSVERNNMLMESAAFINYVDVKWLALL